MKKAKVGAARAPAKKAPAIRIDLQRDFALRGQTDLDAASALAQAQHRVAASGGDTESVDTDVCAAMGSVLSPP